MTILLTDTKAFKADGWMVRSMDCDTLEKTPILEAVVTRIARNRDSGDHAIQLGNAAYSAAKIESDCDKNGIAFLLKRVACNSAGWDTEEKKFIFDQKGWDVLVELCQAIEQLWYEQDEREAGRASFDF